MEKYIKEKKILRKYFHGLSDEQFNEDVTEYPLNSVLGAIEEALNQKKDKHWIVYLAETYPAVTIVDNTYVYLTIDEGSYVDFHIPKNLTNEETLEHIEKNIQRIRVDQPELL
jgi:threonyl-tRNA synthetase